MEISQEDRTGILDAIEIALDEQEYYLNQGDALADYGDEWPEIAQHKAERFNRMATVAHKLEAPTLTEDCTKLAQEFLRLATVEEEDDIGPCVDCGAQCYADGSLAVLCPTCDGPQDSPTA